MTTIFYHKNCLDGLASAGVVLHYVPNARCIAVDYSTDMVKLLKECNGDIVMVDFGVSPQVIEEADPLGTVTIIDHHKTMIDHWKDVIVSQDVHLHFDSSQAGVQLVSEFYGEKEQMTEVERDIARYDLWLDEGNNKYVQGLYAMGALSLTPLEWNQLQVKIYDRFSDFEYYCDGVVDAKELEIKELTQPFRHWQYRWLTVDDQRYLVAFVKCRSSVRNEVASRLLANYPDVNVVAAYAGGDNVSLRCRKGKDDARRIATKFNGGGHDSAAGCDVSILKAFDSN